MTDRQEEFNKLMRGKLEEMKAERAMLASYKPLLRVARAGEELVEWLPPWLKNDEIIKFKETLKEVDHLL